MRHALVVVFVVVGGCSKPSDKPKPEEAPSDPSKPGKKEMTVTGTLALTGALAAQVEWKPDLAFTCACIGDGDVWAIDATLTNGSDTFVSIDIGSTKGMTMGSAKLHDGRLKGDGMNGITASCKPDRRNSNGVFSIDLDTTLKGPQDQVTVKGHLDIVCRDGL